MEEPTDLEREQIAGPRCMLSALLLGSVTVGGVILVLVLS
jgi:hypothetical protein